MAHLSGISRHNTPPIIDGATHELSSHEPLPHTVQANNTEKSDSAKADCDTIEQSQKPFPFLQLPAEIRNKIYDQVLTEGRPKDKDSEQIDDHFPWRGDITYSPAEEPLSYALSVLLVSKQLNAEMTSRIYNCLAKGALDHYAHIMDYTFPGSPHYNKQHDICAVVVKDVDDLEKQVRFRILEQRHFSRQNRILPGG